MTIGTNWNVCPVDATWANYSAHDAEQQSEWRSQYAAAAEAAEAAARYQALQAVAIAGIQAAAADHAADRQWDIANRQMEIAEEEYERYKEFFICNEHKMADEACEIEVPTADYDTRADRAQADVRREFATARRRLNRTRSRYCLADFSRALCQIDAAEARAVAAARDTAYRHEEQHVRALDDVRFSRAATVFGLGRGIQQGQSATYQSAMGLASDSLATRLGGLNNFLGAVSGGIQGMIQANYASQIAPSPFTNTYAASGPHMVNQSSIGYSLGGPSPFGSSAVVNQQNQAF